MRPDPHTATSANVVDDLCERRILHALDRVEHHPLEPVYIPHALAPLASCSFVYFVTLPFVITPAFASVNDTADGAPDCVDVGSVEIRRLFATIETV